MQLIPPQSNPSLLPSSPQQSPVNSVGSLFNNGINPDNEFHKKASQQLGQRPTEFKAGKVYDAIHKSLKESYAEKAISDENLVDVVNKHLPSYAEKSNVSLHPNWNKAENLDTIVSEGKPTENLRNVSGNILSDYLNKLNVKNVHADVTKSLSPDEQEIAGHLSKAWELNHISPHGYGNNSLWGYELFHQKSDFIKKAVDKINSGDSGKIKSWNKDGVTYFDVDGRQVSFHGDYGVPGKNPEYAPWIGTRSSLNPLNLDDKKYNDLKNHQKSVDDLRKLTGMVDFGELTSYHGQDYKPLMNELKEKSSELQKKYDIKEDILKDLPNHFNVDEYQRSLSDRELQENFTKKTGLRRDEFFPYFFEGSGNAGFDMSKNFNKNRINELIDRKTQSLERELKGNEDLPSIDKQIESFKSKNAKGRLTLIERKDQILSSLNKLKNKDHILQHYMGVGEPHLKNIEKLKELDKGRRELQEFLYKKIRNEK